MAKDHIVAAPKPIETEVLIARGYGPTAYPSEGPPTNALSAFIRKQYPGEWLVRIPALGHDGATARVTFKGKPGWRCDCPKWVSTHSCKHVEAAFVMHGGRPFARPMPKHLEQLNFLVDDVPENRRSGVRRLVARR